MTGDPDDFLDIKQAARLLNVSETSLRRWTNSGELRAYRIGRRRERRFKRADLLAFIAAPIGHADGLRIGSPPGASESRPALSEVDQRNHFCGFYSSEAGRTRLAVAFLGNGDSNGTAKFLIAEPKVRAAVLKAVKTLSASPSRRGRLNGTSLVTDVYRNSVKAQLEYWHRAFEEALAAGATSMRVVGDACGFAKRTSHATLMQYEAEYERLVTPRYPVQTLCLYDARLLSGRDAVRALKEHGDTLRRDVDSLLD